MTSRRRPNRAPATVDGATGIPDPAPRRERVRPIRLDTLAAIRSELGTVYRLARTGRISTSDLTKFAFALRQLADMTIALELEARITRLEENE